MDCIGLLKRMIETPSFSREEDCTAQLLYDTMAQIGLAPQRFHNNVWALSAGYDPERPTLMLNSHHDTVRPAAGYTHSPFSPIVTDGRLYGLGSNDAGASVVTLLSLFAEMSEREMPFNLLLALTAEEEVTGEKGMRAFLPYLAEKGIKVDMALVGEPTGMQPAIAERGLVVLDCVTRGVAGHAARNEGVNAIYNAVADMERLRSFEFPEQSEVLGPIGLQITQIEAGRQHNVVPDECRWVVDVRTTDAFTNEETVALLQGVVCNTQMTPRSTRIRASVIEEDHPMVRAATKLGLTPFVSPTGSDMSQMSAFPSLKMGPGQSSRSHTADEYVELIELANATMIYKNYLNELSNIIAYETK